MSDPKLISPLLDGFAMGSPISDHDGVVCCPAVKENSDNKYIVKIISVPASQSQLDAFLLTGAYKDPADAMEYFKHTVDGMEQEAKLLQKLSKLEGFLPYDSWQIEPMDENRLGYEVYLISSYKRSLKKFVSRNPMTHLGAVNLGVDICAALAIARRAGYIYVDLKPTNIFISEDREFRIGDLGFLELASLKYASLPGKYVSAYTPPEMKKLMGTVNTTADTYALGMILYQLYNNGQLPEVDPDSDEPLPFPVNADYEMAEIIGKATAPKVSDRYADPMEMGQALVAYMHRNRVGDTPITPPLAEPIAQEEPLLEKNFDDSIPGEEDAVDASLENISEETSSMLDQADLLMSDAPLDAPASAEDPQPEAPETAEDPLPDDACDFDDSDVLPPVLPPEDLTEEIILPEDPADPLPDSEIEDITIPPMHIPPDDEVMNFDEFLNMGNPEKAKKTTSDKPKTEKKAPQQKKGKKKKKKKKSKLVPVLFTILLLLIGIMVGGYYYYDNYYLQTIHSIQVDGSGDEMTVTLDTEADNSLLTILITDTYGNTQRSAVTNNRASFDNLLPGTLYKIRVEISGFHGLHPKGVASHGYTTDSQTKIVSFTAKTGSEDGSVVLNFAVEGPNAESWIVNYAAGEEEPQTQEFTGHMATITGLEIGKEYTFTLAPKGDLILLGETEIRFTASRIVMAEDLKVTEFNGSSLSVSWQTPADTLIDGWTVRCYAESEYDKTLTTTENSATFTDIDASKAYTIEVLASGMTNPARLAITPNPHNVYNIQVDESQSDRLTVTWEHEGEAPAEGWILTYQVDNSSNPGVAQCQGNSAVIQPRIPGATYTFQVLAASGASVFGGTYTYDCPNAPIFEAVDLLIEKEDVNTKLGVQMLVTPDIYNWTNSLVSKDAFTTSFKSGEKVSLLLHMNTNFLIRDLNVNVLFVIRDAQGNVLNNHVSQIDTDWSTLWYPDHYQYAELDVPSVPQESGTYTLYVYFNNAAMTSIRFTIQ